jgi:hypothetical protein
MTVSVLFEKADDAVESETAKAPAFFVDLNLDQIIDAITGGRPDYDLKPFFYTPLRDVNAIQYRHAVMQDLENKTLLQNIKVFAEQMVIVRRYLGLTDRLEFRYHKEGWFLEAAVVYCEAIHCLARDLAQADLKPRGWVAFRDYVTNYAQADSFTTLAAETQQLRADLSTVKYCVLIKNLMVKVRKYEGELDYSVAVEQTFEKFKQGAVNDYTSRLASGAGMSHVEAQILECVAQLYPAIFARLVEYCAQHADFLDETIRVFDRQVQFYVAYLDYVACLKRVGLNFCYPRITTAKDIYVYDGFDPALAYKLAAENSPVVCNDFFLRGPERVLVVSGPNQGGKTTFARAFGQLHYLASLGCPVPGREAQLYLFDQLYTHFEKMEDIANLRGKLQDDLVRIHAILGQATPRSLIIMNEIFSSTTLQDAVFLSKQIMARITQLDLICVFVTFIDELASLNAKTVSMVSTIAPDNPAVRTFKIVRKPADGLAYALSIAEKHRLTYQRIKERIKA